MLYEVRGRLMKVQTSLQKKTAVTMLLSSLVVALLPSMAFCGNLTLPISPSNPYDLTSVTVSSFNLVTDYKNAWCVLNPLSAEDETKTQTLSIRKDADNQKYLAFDGSTLPEESFLALRIGSISNDTYTPYNLCPEKPNVITHRSLNITTRFEPSGEFPSLADDEKKGVGLLRQLYPDYANASNMNQAYFYAAKLGICVKDDGYFYIARVRASDELIASMQGNQTLPSQGLIFEWVRTNVAYMDDPNPGTSTATTGVDSETTGQDVISYVGNGRVEIRVESYAFRADADSPHFVIAYCLSVKGPKNTDYVSLTEGLGYSWLSNPTDGAYSIDFSSLGKNKAAKWLFPIDNACVGTYDATSHAQLELESLSTLNMVAFSASAGGLYKVELEEKADIPSLASLATIREVGAFAAYANLSSPMFTLFADWVDRHQVQLENHLSALSDGRTISTLGTKLYSESQGCETTEETFNAFLLDMDPKEKVEQKLSVASVVPDDDCLMLTVVGPDGCNLKDAISRAGRLYVKRAATIADFATATSVPVDTIEGAAIATDTCLADGKGVCITLPRKEGEKDMPFVQVTLEAAEIVE